MFVKPGATKMIKAKRKESFFTDYIQEVLEGAKLGISKEEIIGMIKSMKGR